jgi:DNA replication protein DnaC
VSEASVYQRLRGHLAALRMTATAEVLPQALERATADGISHTAFLERLLAVEVAAAEARRQASLARFACLPAPWRIADFDFDAQPSLDRKLVAELATLRFVEDKGNVLLIGPPGVGKTMLAVALGHAAVEAGMRTYSTTAAELVARCHKAALEGRWATTMRFYAGPRLLIIDELGYLPMPSEGAAALFQVVTQRYGKGSIVLTTNLGVGRGAASSTTRWSPRPCWTGCCTDRSCSTSTVSPTGCAPTGPEPSACAAGPRRPTAVAPDLTSPSGDDAATIPDDRILVCPVCQRQFTPLAGAGSAPTPAARRPGAGVTSRHRRRPSSHPLAPAGRSPSTPARRVRPATSASNAAATAGCSATASAWVEPAALRRAGGGRRPHRRGGDANDHAVVSPPSGCRATWGISMIDSGEIPRSLTAKADRGAVAGRGRRVLMPGVSPLGHGHSQRNSARRRGQRPRPWVFRATD